MEPETKKSMVMPIAITVLITALIFGAGGYYLAGGFGASDTSTDVSPSPSPKTTITATASPSAELKTYEHQDFTLQHPADWGVSTTVADNFANETASYTITFRKGEIVGKIATLDSNAPKLTILINDAGRGAKPAAIKYDFAYASDVMKVTNRQSEKSNDMGTPIEGDVLFYNSGGSTIKLNNDVYYFRGENLENRADEDAVVAMVSSFKLKK